MTATTWSNKGTSPVREVRPLRDTDRTGAARLYWEGFGDKLGRVLSPSHKAERFLAAAIQPQHGLVAVDAAGTILGVAGLKTDRGGFVAAGFVDLARVYGLGALWRAPLLELFARSAPPGTLHLDGLCVTATARSQGVGSALIEALASEARAAGADTIELHVIDSNPRARALYTRHGFAAVATKSPGFWALLIGFGKYTTMVRKL